MVVDVGNSLAKEGIDDATLVVPDKAFLAARHEMSLRSPYSAPLPQRPLVFTTPRGQLVLTSPGIGHPIA